MIYIKANALKQHIYIFPKDILLSFLLTTMLTLKITDSKIFKASKKVKIITKKEVFKLTVVPIIKEETGTISIPARPKV